MLPNLSGSGSRPFARSEPAGAKVLRPSASGTGLKRIIVRDCPGASNVDGRYRSPNLFLGARTWTRVSLKTFRKSR